MKPTLRACALLAAIFSTYLAAESYDEKAATVDMNDPHQLYDLAMWCGENQLERKKFRLLRDVLDIDSDYPPARAELGFVQYKGKWVHESRLPDDARRQAEQQGEAAGEPPRDRIVQTSGPGPSADEIDWGLQKLDESAIDQSTRRHLKKYMNQMVNTGSFSNQMRSAVATMLMDRYFQTSVVLMANGLLDGSHRDLNGAALMIQEVRRGGDREKGRWVNTLVPYIAEAAKKTTDPKDLTAYAMVASLDGDKRHVPALIEMLSSTDELLATTAKYAISKVTMLDERSVTKESAQQWWNKYHASSNAAIYGNMLSSSNPDARLAACRRLYSSQDKRILPVLADLLVVEQPTDRPIALGAAQLVKRITGTDWNLLDVDSASRAEDIASYRQWLDEQSHRFIWVEFRNQSIKDDGPTAAGVASTDTIGQWILQLNSLDDIDRSSAEKNLRNAGMEAAPKLVDALTHEDLIIRQRVRDLLRTISKQNYGLDPLGPETEQRAAVAKWRAWLQEQQGEAATPAAP